MNMLDRWAIALGEDLFSSVRGVSYEKSDASALPSKGLVPILRANNISSDGWITIDDLVYVPERYVSSEQYLKDGDLLIAASSGSRSVVGKAARVSSEYSRFAFGAFCTVARPRRKEFALWLSSYMKSRAYRVFVESVALGININNLRSSDLKAMPIWIAPLPEQQRIVTKIGSLSTKSKRARDQLDHIPRLVEKYKQTILAAAFAAKLSPSEKSDKPIDLDVVASDKRELLSSLNLRPWNGEVIDRRSLRTLPSGWNWLRVGDVAAHRSGLAFKSETFGKTGMQVIRLGNLYNGRLDLSRSPVFLSPDAAPAGTFTTKENDIVVSLTGTKYKRDYGSFVKLDSSTNVFVNQRVLCLTCTKSLVPDFLVYYSQTPEFRDCFFSKETGGVNQGNVSVAGVMDAPIPIPAVSTQQKVAAGIQTAFGWIERLASETTNARKLIDHLDRAILAKAFRGELVPQDPSDEPASVLLERIRAEREVKSSIKRPTIKKKK